MASIVKHVTFDTRNAKAVAEFWAAALDLEVVGDASEHFAVVGGPNRPERHPALMFQQVPEGKELKNRIHLDLETEDPVSEIARLEALGATRVEDKDEWNFQWTIMADVEGNEFCVLGPAQPLE